MPELDKSALLTILLDTGPLISLCAYQIRKKPIIEFIWEYTALYISSSVAHEALAQPSYSDAHVAKSLIQSGRILTLAPPKTPVVLDTYTKLGAGERDIIRIGISKPELTVVIDDHFAFVVANRFGLHPTLLLDVLVQLVQGHGLPKALGQEIVQSLALRYATPFIKHTLQKLE